MPEGRAKSDSTISVAVPTRGRAAYLDQCLQSIARQTLSADEIVVSEDGADPQTSRVVCQYVDKGVPIRHVTNVPPLGQLGNRRRAFEMTSGTFVAMLDDDDVWEPDFLELTSAPLRQGTYTFCSADHFIINTTAEILIEESDRASSRFGRTAMQEGAYDDVLLRHLLSKPFSLHSTLFVRSALASTGFFPEYSGVVPDFALFLELGAARAVCRYIPKRLGGYRVHPGQQNRDRVETGESLIDCLEGFCDRHPCITSRERDAAERLHRDAVVELGIAYAHLGKRKNSVRALRSYGALAWRPPRYRRLLVLAWLLASGGRPRRRSA